MSTSNKIFLAAIILCVGAFVSYDIAQLPEPSTNGFTLSDIDHAIGGPHWTIWDYLALVFLTCSIGLMVAGIKLRQR
jgi:hypothetical protein